MHINAPFLIHDASVCADICNFNAVYSPWSPCSDGVDRTGAFICAHAQLERLKAEGVVDFLQFLKAARGHRAGLVQTVVGTCM